MNIETEKFREFLRKAADEVATWPRWKQSILGGLMEADAPLVDERKNYGMTPLRWAVVPPDFYEPIAVFEYRDQAEDWQKRNYPSCRVLDCRCWLDTEGRMMFRVLRVPVVQGSNHGGAEGTEKRRGFTAEAQRTRRGN